MLIVLPEKDARDICDTLRSKCFLFQPITAPKAIDYLNNMIGDIFDGREVDPGYPLLINFPLPSYSFSKTDLKRTIEFDPSISLQFSVEV